MDLNDLQSRVGAWADTAIGATTTREQHGLKVCEEAGELARAIGCQSAAVRAQPHEWEPHIRREAADVVLAVVFLAHRFGFDLAEAITDRFDQVQHRDATAARLPKEN